MTCNVVDTKACVIVEPTVVTRNVLGSVTVRAYDTFFSYLEAMEKIYNKLLSQESLRTTKQSNQVNNVSDYNGYTLEKNVFMREVPADAWGSEVNKIELGKSEAEIKKREDNLRSNVKQSFGTVVDNSGDIRLAKYKKDERLILTDLRNEQVFKFLNSEYDTQKDAVFNENITHNINELTNVIEKSMLSKAFDPNTANQKNSLKEAITKAGLACPQ